MAHVLAVQLAGDRAGRAETERLGLEDVAAGGGMELIGQPAPSRAKQNLPVHFWENSYVQETVSEVRLWEKLERAAVVTSVTNQHELAHRANLVGGSDDGGFRFREGFEPGYDV